ncbi:MAG: glycosyltransferase family 2 protein [Alphaproteobacteria bacterium]|nr:glycosyltransferase family 2 protein [Alphaproteobacteria bacterium]
MSFFSFDNVKKRENFDDLTLKLTVIVICYNHEDTVVRAMDSILMQKVDFDYEILVCDDCSGDKSQEILLRYKDKFKHIKFLFNKKRHGNKVHHCIFSLAMAFPQTKGQYITLLESDDYYLDDTKFQQQIEILDKNPELTGCYSNYMIDNKAKSTKTIGMEMELANKLPMTIKSDDWFTQGLYVHTTTLMLRNIFQDSWVDIMGFQHSGDSILQLLYVYHGDIGFINKPLSCYFMTGKGTWTSASDLQKQYGLLMLWYALNKLCNGRFFIRYIGRASNQIENIIANLREEENMSRRKRSIFIIFCKILWLLNGARIMLHEEKQPRKRWLFMVHHLNDRGLLQNSKWRRLLLKILVRSQIDAMIVKTFWFLYEYLYMVPTYVGFIYFKIKFYRYL